MRVNKGSVEGFVVFMGLLLVLGFYAALFGWPSSKAHAAVAEETSVEETTDTEEYEIAASYVDGESDDPANDADQDTLDVVDTNQEDVTGMKQIDITAESQADVPVVSQTDSISTSQTNVTSAWQSSADAE